MIEGKRREDITIPEIVVRTVKNCPEIYDPEARVLLIDADSILYTSTYFPEDSLMEFPTEEEQIEEFKFRINSKLQEIQNNVEEWFNILQTIIFVGGKNNFRYKVFPEYKKHRTYTNHLVPLAKKYIIEELNAIPSNGGEADDYVIDATIATHYKCVVSSIDKDVLYHCPNIPYYDYRGHSDVLGTFKFISLKQSRMFRASQMIIGDSTDGIKGAFGLGESWCKKNLNENMTDYQFVKNIFIGYIKSTKGDVKKARDEMNLNYKLLKLHTLEEIKKYGY